MGVGKITGSLFTGILGGDVDAISGNSGTTPLCPVAAVCPDGFGSDGNGGISGSGTIGKSTVVATGTSCMVCFGSGGASGAPGNGISPAPVTVSEVPGCSGVVTAGCVVERGAKAGTRTAPAPGSTTPGISLKFNTKVAGLLLVVPWVVLPGGKGGGTCQSDALFICAMARVNNAVASTNANSIARSALWRLHQAKTIVYVVCLDPIN